MQIMIILYIYVRYGTQNSSHQCQNTRSTQIGNRTPIAVLNHRYVFLANYRILSLLIFDRQWENIPAGESKTYS